MRCRGGRFGLSGDARCFGGKNALSEKRGLLGVGAVTLMLGITASLFAGGNAAPGAAGLPGAGGGMPLWDCVRACARVGGARCARCPRCECDACVESEEQLALAALHS